MKIAHFIGGNLDVGSPATSPNIFTNFRLILQMAGNLGDLRQPFSKKFRAIYLKRRQPGNLGDLFQRNFISKRINAHRLWQPSQPISLKSN